ALSGRTVLVVEKERYIGAHTSSRNSEIIHAGLYYPADSLKARFCVAGRKQLYAYCAARAIEPEVACIAAFHSPSTGLIDSHALMLSLHGEAEAHGATVALRAEVA